MKKPPKKVAHNQSKLQTLLFHSPAQATAHSTKLIFHIMKSRDQTSVLLSVSKTSDTKLSFFEEYVLFQSYDFHSLTFFIQLSYHWFTIVHIFCSHYLPCGKTLQGFFIRHFEYSSQSDFDFFF